MISRHGYCLRKEKERGRSVLFFTPSFEKKERRGVGKSTQAICETISPPIILASFPFRKKRGGRYHDYNSTELARLEK